MRTGEMCAGEKKRLVYESDQLPPSNAEVKKMWSYNTTAPYAFISWYLRIKSLWGARFSAPVQTGSGARPARMQKILAAFPWSKAAGTWR